MILSGIFRAIVAVAIVSSASAQTATKDILRKSLVRIETVSQDPDYTAPWNTGSIGRGIGAGFVIEGNRILTNAHVVSNARMIWLTRDGDPNRYPATVRHIAHDCDLAMLEPEDPKFFDRMMPLAINGLPEVESTVMVYGYPIGGERPSVTRGIVSRIDFQEYSHSGADMHLVIQIDAAINPGNSGGPVMQDGKVVGVAFQGYSGDVAQNTGYMIPTPVVLRFLKDVEDGKYDRYVDLALSYFPLYNKAARAALGLEDDGVGVMVGDVFGSGSADGIVKRGDVIVAIDGHPVASDGSVELDDSYVEMAELVERKLKGDRVKLDIVRDGKLEKLEVPLNEPFPFNIYAYGYDVKPRFVLFGGLLFQPLDQNYLSSTTIHNSRTSYYFDHFISDAIYKERPELVILSNILSDPVNAYAAEFRQAIVDTINGEKMKTLADVATAFEKPAEYYVIEFLGASRPLVLEAEAVASARERIRSRYGVTKESNLEP